MAKKTDLSPQPKAPEPSRRGSSRSEIDAFLQQAIREYRRVPHALAVASGAERASIDACT